ncbi:MAG: GntR family transcriptional regulator [Erysipelotrichaceae bacterium]|nr:GntR family transcriptional regulator [Erysipelotrichaceae bacterium]
MILKFDFESSEPLYMQIRNQIVVGIGEGRLKPGEKLPTIRALAEESGINMMTVSKAYQMLKQEGFIVTDRRSGAIVKRRENTAGVSDSTIKALRISFSELRAAGLDKKEIIDLCEKICEEGEVK